MSRLGATSLALLTLAAALAPVAPAQPILDRDPAHYGILGMRRVRLKNFAMEPGICHVGVNCVRPTSNSACGVLRGKNVSFGADGQLVGDSTCLTGTLFQVFRNNVGTSCSPDCSMIASPGPAGDCTSPFSTPILGDLDGDGTPSCSDDCKTDLDDVAAACGVTLPFPPCDAGRPILALPDADCGVDDVLVGNFQCDLAAGAYGTIRVANGGRLSFGPGTTVACSVKAGKAVRVKSAGPAVVLVPGAGTIKINNGLDVGSTCGQLVLATERGVIGFGRNGDVTADVCTIAGRLKLGHANNLRGRFIGQDITMDFNNDGRCCPSGPTTTTSTTSSSTSTTDPGASTTTSTGASSTTSSTSTTLPGGFTRTIGFYKNHPAITAQILATHGPLTVCGRTISDIDVDHGHSALEAMCVSPQGDQRIQLVRQLTAAALSTAAGGSQFDPIACNAVCLDAGASVSALTACIDAADAFNNSGDDVAAPWDPPGPADPRPCDRAVKTACTVLSPSLCAAS